MTNVSASSSVTVSASASMVENLTAVQQPPRDGREAPGAPVPGRRLGDLRPEQDPVEPAGRLLRQPDEPALQVRPPPRVLPVERREVDAERCIGRHARL